MKAGVSLTVGALAGHANAAEKSNLTFDAPPLVSVPIMGSAQRFPVRRIYCVGRNYAAHAREMGSDPTREPPFFFQKPTDAVQVVNPGTVGDHPYPTYMLGNRRAADRFVARQLDSPFLAVLGRILRYRGQRRGSAVL